MRAIWSDRGLSRRAFVLIGAAFLGGGLASVVAGGAGALLVFAIGGTLVAFAAARLAPPEDDDFPLVATLVGFGVRSVAALTLHVILVAQGRGGALFLDDEGYMKIATALASSWHGGAATWVDPSLDHNYVRLAAAIIYLLGPNVAALKLVNTVLSVLSAILVYRTMRATGLPGARVGLLAMLVFPSLVLWSSLVLKDTYVLFFATAAAWSIAETIRSRRLRWMLLTIVSLLAMENVRPYLFVILVVTWPLALVIAPLGRRRAPVFALALTAAAVLLSVTEAVTYLDPRMVTAAPYIRRAMALGARSGFVAPNPVARADAGDQFRVTVAARTPVPDPKCVVLPPGHDIVVVAEERAAELSRVFVRPGDVVVVAGASTDPCGGVVAAVSPPSATTTPAPLVLSAETRNIVATPAPVIEDSVAMSRDLIDNLLHLPIGMAFLVGAPFVWEWRSASDVATLPEMIAWYTAFGLGAFGVWLALRERRSELAYPLLVAGAIGLVLSLIEGNTGTLLRHRAMLIPWVVMFAAIALAHLRARSPR